MPVTKIRGRGDQSLGDRTGLQFVHVGAYRAADPAAIAQRVSERGTLTNCYQDSPIEDLPSLIEELTNCCFVAAQEPTQRGIPVEIAYMDGELENSIEVIRRCLEPSIK